MSLQVANRNWLRAQVPVCFANINASPIYMLRRSQNDCITRLFGDKHVSRSRQTAGHLHRTSIFILLEYMSKGVDGKTWSCYAPSTTVLSVQSEQAALLRRVISGHERLDHFCTRLISQKYDTQRERTVRSVCGGRVTRAMVANQEVGTTGTRKSSLHVGECV